MWWFLFILFILISIFSSITLYYALKRITQHERLQLQYEGIINQIQQIINFSTEKMKQLDSSGHFESDDEVGFFFDELKNIQSMLDNLFEIENNEETEDAKKEK